MAAKNSGRLCSIPFVAQRCTSTPVQAITPPNCHLPTQFGRFPKSEELVCGSHARRRRTKKQSMWTRHSQVGVRAEIQFVAVSLENGHKVLMVRGQACCHHRIQALPTSRVCPPFAGSIGPSHLDLTSLCPTLVISIPRHIGSTVEK
jgi:hypothetical protein